MNALQKSLKRTNDDMEFQNVDMAFVHLKTFRKSTKRADENLNGRQNEETTK